MTELSVSLLSADQGNLRGEIERIKDTIDSLHIDVMDGHFVPEIGFGASVIESLRSHFSLPFYAHLMVEKPERHIGSFASAGVDAIFIHYESTPHIFRVLEKIRDKGVKAGIALNPATPLCLLEEIWEFIDILLIMTVNPGYGGQKLLPFTLKKIEKASKIISEKGLPVRISADGGININNIKKVRKAGASILVVGSYIFENDDPARAVKTLRKEIEE